MSFDKIDIIAEIGQSHDGSLGIAHSYIEALANTGVTAVKFQTHLAEAESSEYEIFRKKFSYEDSSRYDYWKRMEFTLDQWDGLKRHCEDVGLEFISSPFSNQAVDLLEKLGVKRYKIGSGETNNFLMLKKIIQTKKPILLSTGMSSFKELDKSVEFIKKRKVDLSILQCTTSYPTISGEWGLKLIPELIKRYDTRVGFSDHSGEIFASLAAVTLGASILEFHVVFDKKIFGPDSESSIEIRDLNQLVNGIIKIKKDMLSKTNFKIDNSKFKSLKSIFEKSLAVNKNLKKGHLLTFDDLESKKPFNKGIPAKDYKLVIGKKINKDLNEWDFLTNSDLNE
ncbi:MAG: N-acetylneuraminate synthase [Flavobacteriaceae bacterium]|nr:N-acetylneuraminate synthase [Flavobacteriaceae bacterium]|tara:strand:- start:3326 stop:4342 length:1017 start_codon:yes stop_codon:yes gene_type:complete